MLAVLSETLFFAVNASADPDVLTVMLVGLALPWLVYAPVILMPALWIWGRHDTRSALLATVVGVSAALGINLLLGLLWYEPRPFMISLGHTLSFHAAENWFPSDHATFLWSLGLAPIATGAARLWGAMVCLSGLFVTCARVYLGLHFSIDVAASFLVALAAGGVAFAVLPASDRRRHLVVHHTHQATLRSLRVPGALFPRGPER